jgi:hypothetical protein
VLPFIAAYAFFVIADCCWMDVLMQAELLCDFLSIAPLFKGGIAE